jgi:hypothetical protein
MACGEPQARGAADAGDEPGGSRADPNLEPGARRSSQIPVLIGWNEDRAAQPGVVQRNHLHLHGARVSVSDGRDGLVQPLRSDIGAVELARFAFLPRGAQESAAAEDEQDKHLFEKLTAEADGILFWEFRDALHGNATD